MKHFGDITKIDGKTVPIVDVITGGSPCQDLSVAGKREGLGGERSGLFMEQIRIIKEMRDADRKRTGRTNEFLRPRFMVWENVEGVFSSNDGEDFRCVLEETIRVVECNAVVPRLPDGQTWSHSGAVMGDNWSIAWRLHDAQFWGVPQRRRRLCLVADFGRQTAPEILFERESLRWDHPKGREAREALAGDSAEGAGIGDRTVPIKMDTTPKFGESGDAAFTLRSRENGGGINDMVLTPWDVQSKRIYSPYGVAPSLQSGTGEGMNIQPCIAMQSDGTSSNGAQNGCGYNEDGSAYTLNGRDRHAVAFAQNQRNEVRLEGV